ncbi:PepSY domain-containing protein [Streptomyces tsukubensis]|uniref:PepSY domain-containing protein n=1 Tax=Streptomyces tsukubensis TaxID=83656 RepID=A0A1V4ADY7_9ACTN|nr:PepSY domain-containing protein [Streptomyces tsukubensis]OON81709.1 hypothetical protein B1H18_06080 [Streptomyces tsukubensis]QFR96487.1 hypothetical protein GBW32_29920 [Streptomyces tsukubensis]
MNPTHRPAPRRRPARALATLVTVAACALTVTACGGSDGGGSDSGGQASGAASTNGSAASGSPSVSPTGSPSLDDDAREHADLLAATKVKAADAAKTALAVKSGTRLSELELERSGRGTPYWEGTLVEKDGTAFMVRVAADTGKAGALSGSDDNDSEDRSERMELLDASTITAAQAADKAAERSPGTPVHIDLDDERGRPVWQVSVVAPRTYQETEVDISAKDGNVLREKTED